MQMIYWRGLELGSHSPHIQCDWITVQGTKYCGHQKEPYLDKQSVWRSSGKRSAYFWTGSQNPKPIVAVEKIVRVQTMDEVGDEYTPYKVKES